MRTIAVECALATKQQKNRISSHRKRIMKRQGKKKAQIASAHLLLTIAYNILKTNEPYQELGPDYIQQAQQNQEMKMIEYLKKKGYSIIQGDQQSA